MNDVNPCPFCGGKSRVHKYLGKWYARCNKCKAYSAPYDTEEQATEAWNRRAGEPCELCRYAPPSSGEYQPVKPAHWYINPGGYYPQCSNCGYEPPRELIRRNGDALIFPRYCPECGADTKRKVK